MNRWYLFKRQSPLRVDVQPLPTVGNEIYTPYFHYISACIYLLLVLTLTIWVSLLRSLSLSLSLFLFPVVNIQYNKISLSHYFWSLRNQTHLMFECTLKVVCLTLINTVSSLRKLAFDSRYKNLSSTTIFERQKLFKSHIWHDFLFCFFIACWIYDGHY